MGEGAQQYLGPDVPAAVSQRGKQSQSAPDTAPSSDKAAEGGVLTHL